MFRLFSSVCHALINFPSHKTTRERKTAKTEGQFESVMCSNKKAVSNSHIQGVKINLNPNNYNGWDEFQGWFTYNNRGCSRWRICTSLIYEGECGLQDNASLTSLIHFPCVVINSLLISREIEQHVWGVMIPEWLVLFSPRHPTTLLPIFCLSSSTLGVNSVLHCHGQFPNNEICTCGTSLSTDLHKVQRN